MTRLNVLACQLEIPLTRTSEQRDVHVERSLARVGTAIDSCAERCDLVVLPELSAIEYSRSAFECLGELAEERNGATFAQVSQFSRHYDLTVVYGYARRHGERCYIAQAAVNPVGELLGVYDKLHLAQYGASMEKEFFTAGDRLLTFDVNGVAVAPIICYDMRFPELARELCTTHGAELLIHCSAFYQDESYPSWPSFVTARAMENQVFMLSLNRAGQNWGGSMFCPPWCDEAAPLVRVGTEETFFSCTVDTDELARVRDGYAFLKDRLPDYRLSNDSG
jgi:predicted amidohydrolase